MQKKILLLILGVFSLTNCKESDNDINSLNTNDESNLKNKIYDIQGKNIFLRDGPGENYNKLLNQKATDAIGERQYMQIDYTCTVTIEEEKNNWAKVKVIDPSHLSSTHYGWIPLKNIIKDTVDISSVNFSQFKYEIISSSENNVSKNYNIYLNINKLSKNEISNFVKLFREKNCSVCSINIFDTKSIKNLINIYPLNRNEYLNFADHFVAWSTFDAPQITTFYPFQDSKYKEYGGKNFKEKKMK